MDKEEFLEQANKANSDALQGKTITDLLNKDSSVYKVERETLPKIVRPPRPEIDEEGFSSLPTGRTFNQDLTGAVKNDNLSMLKVALKNEQIKSAQPEEKTPNTRTFTLIIVTTFLLATAGGLFLWIFLKTKPEENIEETPALIKKIPTVIFAEDKTKINIAKNASKDLKTEIAQELTKKRTKDSIEEIEFVYKENETSERLASFYEVKDALGINPPELLNRSLSDRFFFGIWSDGTKSEPLLILKSDSPQNTLPGMLEWEANLKDEARSIFGTYYTASSYQLNFKDRIVLNQDVRVLENASSTPVFFYTILEKEEIVFARSGSALKRILERIREQKLR